MAVGKDPPSAQDMGQASGVTGTGNGQTESALDDLGGVPGIDGPAARIRALVVEAEERGAPMPSAQAMQARLFAVYDEVCHVPEALDLVQQQLQLTLDRLWYSAGEIEQLADQLDWLLGLGAVEAEVAPTEGDQTGDERATNTDPAQPS